MRCIEKGCSWPAVTGEEYCKSHGKPKLPPAVPVQTESEFEIVALASVPKFRVLNEKAYNTAKTIQALGADKALRLRFVGDAKKAGTFISPIVNQCHRLGFRARHRRSPGFVYFWKDGSKPAK